MFSRATLSAVEDRCKNNNEMLKAFHTLNKFRWEMEHDVHMGHIVYVINSFTSPDYLDAVHKALKVLDKQPPHTSTNSVRKKIQFSSSEFHAKLGIELIPTSQTLSCQVGEPIKNTDYVQPKAQQQQLKLG